MAQWFSTKHAGVRYREHATRKHGVMPDRYFVINFRFGGKLIEEAAGWGSEGMTAAKAAAIRAELKENHRRGEGPRSLSEKREIETERREAAAATIEAEKLEALNFGELFQKYLEWAKDNKKHWKCDESRYRLLIAPLLQNTPLKAVTPFLLDRMTKDIAKAGLTPASQKHALCIVRQCFNKAAAWDLYDGPNPVKKVKMPRLNNAKLRAIDDVEEKILFAELAKRSQEVYDLALTALYGGLRFQEISGLTWRDVNFESRRLTITEGKGGKTRIIPICETLFEMLSRRRAADPSPDNAFIFSSKGKRLKCLTPTYYRAVSATGLNDNVEHRYKLDFHALRHSFATRLAEKGTPPAVLRDLLGHADFQMVSRYSHVMPGAAENAIKSLDERPPQPALAVNGGSKTDIGRS